MSAAIQYLYPRHPLTAPSPALQEPQHARVRPTHVHAIRTALFAHVLSDQSSIPMAPELLHVLLFPGGLEVSTTDVTDVVEALVASGELRKIERDGEILLMRGEQSAMRAMPKAEGPLVADHKKSGPRVRYAPQAHVPQPGAPIPLWARQLEIASLHPPQAAAYAPSLAAPALPVSSAWTDLVGIAPVALFAAGVLGLILDLVM
jgi:hypothetical protein